MKKESLKVPKHMDKFLVALKILVDQMEAQNMTCIKLSELKGMIVIMNTLNSLGDKE